MFEEFEVICPNCEAILRLGAEDYNPYIGQVESKKEKADCKVSFIDNYWFQCLLCGSISKLEIIATGTKK
jgi:hypothetical protein